MTERPDDNEDFIECLGNMMERDEPGFSRDHLIQIWSKVEIAQILQKQAKELLDKAQSDLEFYKIVADQKDLDS